MKKRSRKLNLPGQFDPQWRFAVWYFLVTLFVLWGWQELCQQFAIRTTSYSEFKTRLAAREVAEAAVKQEEIVGRIVPRAARETNAVPAPPGVHRAAD